MIDRVASPAATTPDPATPARKAELAKAAQAFEAVFLRQMIGSMRHATLADDAFGSSASNPFRDMQDARLAESMAEKSAFGIAEMLLKQFDAAVPKATSTSGAKAE